MCPRPCVRHEMPGTKKRESDLFTPLQNMSLQAVSRVLPWRIAYGVCVSHDINKQKDALTKSRGCGPCRAREPEAKSKQRNEESDPFTPLQQIVAEHSSLLDDPVCLKSSKAAKFSSFVVTIYFGLFGFVWAFLGPRSVYPR